MTTRIYLGSCTSSKKAKAWLEKHDIPFVERNIDKQPLTLEEIKAILARTENGTEEIISTRTSFFQELDLDLNNVPLKQLILMIHAKPKLLRRPIIIDEKRLQVGFQKSDIRQFMPRVERKNQLRLALNSGVPSTSF